MNGKQVGNTRYRRRVEQRQIPLPYWLPREVCRRGAPSRLGSLARDRSSWSESAFSHFSETLVDPHLPSQVFAENLESFYHLSPSPDDPDLLVLPMPHANVTQSIRMFSLLLSYYWS